MDKYTKITLTIIAILLSVITIKLTVKRNGTINLFNENVTFGELLDLRNEKDQAKSRETRNNILKNTPIVRVSGGDINVTGNVEIDRQ